MQRTRISCRLLTRCGSYVWTGLDPPLPSVASTAPTTRMPTVPQRQHERPAVRSTSLQLPAATCAFPRRIDTSRHDHARTTFTLPKEVFSAGSIVRESA